MRDEPTLIPELYCSDIQASLSFYQKTLGFRVLYDRPEEGFAMLEREGARMMLEQLQQNSARCWLTGVMEKPYGRGINFQIGVSDIMSLHKSVVNTNAPIILPLEEKWYRTDEGQSGNKQFVVQDPDGYLLRFFQDMGTE